MERRVDNALLKLIWQEQLFVPGGLRGVMGEEIRVVDPGEWDESAAVFFNAEVRIDGTPVRGDILVGCDEELSDVSGGISVHRLYADRAVLQLTGEPGTPLCRMDGTVVPQLALMVPDAVREAYDALISKEEPPECGNVVSALDPFARVTMMTRLLVERLHEKYDDLMEIHRKGGENWSETLYVMLFRTMGDHTNKETFTRLALNVPYNVVSRERGSLFTVEALLLGASGLLEGRTEDDYVLELKREFGYLRRKYAIKPLQPIEWKGDFRSYNAPVLRIVQLAAFLTSQEFIFDNVIACRTPEDVLRLFTAEASDYWLTHFTPGGRTSSFSPKRIGHIKAHLLGINLISHMIFAYGCYLNDEPLREAATALLERIPRENNKLLGRWDKHGIPIEHAFDSQAMLQLTKRYCLVKRCAECNVGKSVIKQKFHAEAPEMVCA